MKEVSNSNDLNLSQWGPYSTRTFGISCIHDPETGRIAIYYGAADSYVGLAFCQFEEIVDYIKKHSVVNGNDTEIGRR